MEAFKVCEQHGENVIMLYQGPACPYCLALDDLAIVKIAVEVAQLETIRKEGTN